jgi:HD-GYP domain-containing protein (c-di-GMP phosphodiesterase class II)
MKQKDSKISSFIESKQNDGFIKINLEWLSFDRSYEFDLYAIVKGQYVLFCGKRLNLTQKLTKKIQKKALYVDQRDASFFQSYMEENIGSILKDTSKPIVEKSQAVFTVSSNLVQDLLNEPKAASINKMKSLVDDQMGFVMSNPGAVQSLMSITEHDYYTYTHSVNVAIYLVGLGEQMKLTSEEIHMLSLGGMLHDLGKAKISLEIINSTGKLTDEEFDEMQKHPDYGVELLEKIDKISKVPKKCFFAISDHHERFCGGGYPKGCAGEDIHLFGRMTKVCDVFDALSTKRSYKDAMTSFDSLKLMKEKMIHEFDPNVFDEFLRLMVGFSKVSVDS